MNTGKPAKHKCLVLIPAYNAARSLPELITRLRASAGGMPVVVIDDGSRDGTAAVAAAGGALVIRHASNRGKGAALRTGFDFAKGSGNAEAVLTMDADLQHEPEDIPGFFRVQEERGADIIIGTRTRIGSRMPAHRIISNTITSALVGMRTGADIRDSQCGFRLIRREVLERVNLEAAGFEAETEFLIKAARWGFKMDFVPVRTVYKGEESHMTHWTTTVNFIKVLFRDYE